MLLPGLAVHHTHTAHNACNKEMPNLEAPDAVA